MKKITKAGIALTLGLSLVFVLNSCEKLADDATETTDSAEDAASDQAAISSLSDLIMDLVTNDPNTQKNGNPLLPPGSYIEYVGGDSVFTDGTGMTISFTIGDPTYDDISSNPFGGVVCSDGQTRWGSGYIEITAPYDDLDCEISLELTKYTALTGNKIVTIDDGNGKRHKKNKRGITKELILKRTSNTSFTLDYNFSIRVRDLDKSIIPKTYTTGTLTIDVTDGGQAGMLDDIMTLSGLIEGDNSGEKYYTVTITEPLVRKLEVGCSNTFVQGKMELKNDGSKFTIKSDFGDGTCDNLVEVTLPGNVKKTITVE